MKRSVPLISTQHKREGWTAALSSEATSAVRKACRCSRMAPRRVPSLETVNPQWYSFWQASVCHSRSGSCRMEKYPKVWKERRGTDLWALLRWESWCVKPVSQPSAPETHLCPPPPPLGKDLCHLLYLSRCHSVL